ncbi:MAG: hypothetical protein NC388_09725 [Clostridium sp.]|nr:hypothetical protein [Clostridium sp.]
MKHFLVVFLFFSLLLGGCREPESEPELYGLPGVWMLSSYTSPTGRVKDYPIEGMTFCRIYSPDTTYYDCQLMSTPSGIIIIPQRKGEFEIIDKGG